MKIRIGGKKKSNEVEDETDAEDYEGGKEGKLRESTDLYRGVNDVA